VDRAVTEGQNVGKSKTFLFAVITILIALISLELLARAAFHFLGRWDTWGYTQYEYVYRPYIGYAYQPYEGGRDRYGFNLDSNDNSQRDLRHKEVCEFRVFMLGGSTVLGRYLDSKDDTLPARLERLLNQRQSITGIDISVINAGKPAFISVQTLLEHALYIKYSLQPDYVVHFDGSNDSVGQPKYWPKGRYPGVQDNLHRYTEDFFAKINEITSLRGSMNALLRNLSSYSAVIFILHKTLNDPSVWLRQMTDKDVLKSDTDAGKDDGAAMNEWVQKHVRRYIFNVDLATRLGDRRTGVAYFLQPTMLPEMEPSLTDREKDFLHPDNYATDFHGYQKRDSKQLYYSLVREEFKKLIGEKNSEYVVISDLSRLFDNKNPDEAYFGDYVHYLPTGRTIIAKEIEKIIWPKIQEQINHDPRFRECRDS